MTDSPGARPRVRITDSKERLFAASMQLLGTRGPNSVSVEEIAQMAGVSKGTVYYNFGSKDKMIGQMLDFGADLLMTELNNAAAQGEPLVALHDMTGVAMDFIEKYPSFAQLWIGEQLRPDSTWGEQLTPLHAQVTGLIQEVLERLVVLDEAEKLPAATAIFGAALFTARIRTSGQNHLEREQAVTAVLRTVDGLLATHDRVSR